MNQELDSLLKELEDFGKQNDFLASDRQLKMLNIPRETGVFLSLLILLMNARRILEIGTSNGYSTLWMAQAVQQTSGKVTTFEISSTKAEMARKNFEKSGLRQFIDPRLEDSDVFLNTQPDNSLDLIFLDADRTHYLSYWSNLKRLLKPRGLLVMDNAVNHSQDVEGFVKLVSASPEFLCATVPVGTGEFLALKE